MTLNDLKPGMRAHIAAWGDQIPDRLLEMGLLPGVEIELIRVAPLGDPLALKIQNAQLAIRRADAARIQVDVL